MKSHNNVSISFKFNRIQIVKLPSCLNISDFLTEGSKRAYIFSKHNAQACQLLTQNGLSWSTVDEKIITEDYGFMISGDHYFYEAFNDKIYQLFESGVTGHIVEKEKNLIYFGSLTPEKLKQKEEKTLNIVLTLYHLQPWFYALLFFLTNAFVVFTVEIMAAKFYIFESKFESKHMKKKDLNSK